MEKDLFLIELESILDKYEELVFDQYDGHIKTYTGKYFNPANPSIDSICLEDIARSLSKMPRFSGQSVFPYPVSDHSIFVSKDVARRTGDLELARAAFLHDSTEAYLCDLPSPVKVLCLIYKRLEHRVERKVIQKFNLKFSFDHYEIKQSDKTVFLFERPQLFHPVAKAQAFEIVEKNHEQAYEAFMQHAQELGFKND